MLIFNRYILYSSIDIVISMHCILILVQYTVYYMKTHTKGYHLKMLILKKVISNVLLFVTWKIFVPFPEKKNLIFDLTPTASELFY